MTFVAEFEQDHDALPSDDEREAFRDGVSDAQLGYEVEACPWDDGPLREAWLRGHALSSRYMP
jgi:hypothetical protein